MAELDTMNKVKEANKEMEKLNDLGKHKEAARIGMRIVSAFGHETMVELQAYKACFEEVKMDDFYQHVIKTAKEIMNQYFK